MIANSHPYSQAQQQRCVGIGQQQQNSLYGSNITTTTTTATATTNNNSNIMSHQQQQAAASGNLRSSHMLDLANLHQQNSLFDSAYDDASQINNNSDQISHTVANNKHHNDISLYSPSSSTSLLYHVYDQINVPNDQAQTASNNNHFKRSNTTTILNPANLFGPTMVNNSNSQQQQQQLAVPQNMKTTTIPQQELYSSGAQFHLHQPSFSNTLHHHNHNQQQLQQQQQQHNNYSLDNNHQMMLDTILRQQHAATARAQQQYHNRPLSSSGASSMSGQSMALTYNRQARNHLPPLPPPINSANKSLANVLQSSQTLNHLGLSSNGHLTPTTIDTRGPKKLAHHQFPSVATSASGTVGMTSRKWKRAQQRVRSVAYEYGTILKCSLLLILLAVCSISIIKFASFNQVDTSYASNQNFLNHQVPSIHSSSFSSNTAQSNMNPLIYPPTKLTDQTNSMAQLPNAQSAELDQNGGMFVSNQASPASAGPTVVAAPDVLKSKLVIGEFVILSQNYTNSPAQKSLLFENIVKLMDQVFLSTEVRRVYSRMEITGIRPFRPSGGIVVDCSIVLSESIAYAAQQFGIALYESLTKSNGKLANQPSFIIDKNSIRLNTVPDKDLGIVPPELIPSTFPRTDATGNFGASGQLTPPGQSNRQPIGSVDFMTNSDGQLQQPPVSEENAVVWSEWSQWSSCVDKNGVCDATRLHSRLRKCVSQHTGDKVDPNQCRQRFNMQDLDLEVDDCAHSCPLQPNGGASGTESHIMSDAPSVILPQTAPPSVMIAGTDRDSPPAFLLPAPLGVHRGLGLKSGSGKLPAQVVDSLGTNGLAANRADQGDAYLQQSSASSTPMAIVSQSPPTAVGSTTEHGLAQPSSPQSTINSNSDLPVLISAPQLDNQQQQQQMSCSNCTSDEICLLLVHQKVPFCAKVKDRLDESGCGGWCKAQGQLCQPVGQNAFKCIHDSECLRDEWRCHDSACIPLSKRCDGHSNCYDSSDERDCPNPIPNR